MIINAIASKPGVTKSRLFSCIFWTITLLMNINFYNALSSIANIASDRQRILIIGGTRFSGLS